MKLKISGLFFLSVLCLFFILSYGIQLGYLYNTPLCLLVSFVCLIPFLLGLYYFIKIKTEISKKNQIFLCLFSAFMSLFLIYSFNIYKHNKQVPVDIEIFPANLKNEYSNGYDIYLRTITIDDKEIYLEEFSNNNNIKKEVGLWGIPMFVLKPSSNIQIKTNANKIYLAFWGGNDTGKVSIKINNKTYTKDTFYYNDNCQYGENSLYDRLYIFNTDNSMSAIQKIGKVFYIFSYFIIFYLINFFWGLITLSFNISTEKKDVSSCRLSARLRKVPPEV